MKKPDWKPQNPWFYGAFPVCRNYTVRAQLCQPALRKWRQLEGNPGMAGAQWYWNDFQHLHPSGLQQQGFFCECDPGVLPGEHWSTDHWAIEKPWTVKLRAENSGAGGGTRTHTDFSTRFWVAVVCQFRHTGIYIFNFPCVPHISDFGGMCGRDIKTKWKYEVVKAPIYQGFYQGTQHSTK